MMSFNEVTNIAMVVLLICVVSSGAWAATLFVRRRTQNQPPTADKKLTSDKDVASSGQAVLEPITPSRATYSVSGTQKTAFENLRPGSEWQRSVQILAERQQRVARVVARNQGQAVRAMARSQERAAREIVNNQKRSARGITRSQQQAARAIAKNQEQLARAVKMQNQVLAEVRKQAASDRRQAISQFDRSVDAIVESLSQEYGEDEQLEINRAPVIPKREMPFTEHEVDRWLSVFNNKVRPA